MDSTPSNPMRGIKQGLQRLTTATSRSPSPRRRRPAPRSYPLNDHPLKAEASSLVVDLYIQPKATGEGAEEWRFTQRIKALETESRLYQKQAVRLRTEPGEVEKTISRAWMLLTIYYSLHHIIVDSM
jgi:hypothetical protein